MVFIRKKFVKGHYYYFLVKSVRKGNKVKQVILENLGRLDDALITARERGLKLPERASKQEHEREKILDNQIKKEKTKYDLFKPFSTETEKVLQEDILYRWVYNSNAIEGSTLSLADTTKFLKEGKRDIYHERVKDYTEAENHREAINYLYKLVKTKRSLTAKDMQHINYLLVQNTLEEDLKGQEGKWRDYDVYIKTSKHSFPKHGDVPKLMKQYIKQFNKAIKTEDVANISGKLHERFEAIHPFVDGNGRTGRILLNYIMIKKGHPPIVIQKRRRRSYFKALEIAHITEDFGEMRRFMKENILAALSHSNYILKHEKTKKKK